MYVCIRVYVCVNECACECVFVCGGGWNLQENPFEIRRSGNSDAFLRGTKVDREEMAISQRALFIYYM